METYVIGRIDRARADNGDIGGVIERIMGLMLKTSVWWNTGRVTAQRGAGTSRERY